MQDAFAGRFRDQVQFLRRQFLQDGELPFSNVLSVQLVTQAAQAAGVRWLDRIYTPLVTLGVFLGQVLSADHSCRAAVARLIAHRVARGVRPCSGATGAYCQARERLPELFFSQTALQTGRELDAHVKPEWLWKGRRVYAYDGSTVAMADTPANQAAYQQPAAQRPGLGFPVARIAAVFSLACGAIVDLGICRYAGKGQSELSLLRMLMRVFQPGDVVLGDRMMCSYISFILLQQRGVECLFRLANNRRADFRRGRRLGPHDHVVTWRRPEASRTMAWKTFSRLPEQLTVRECRVRLTRPGFRSKSLTLVTTLLDAEQYSKQELVELYRARWNAELDLRSLKATLQMAELRGKTPEAVRKELWMHVLAYNLIRTVMAQAASLHDLPPRTISFRGAVQTLEAFQPVLALTDRRGALFRRGLYQALLAAVATHRVGLRPNRFEPRLRKRRHGKYDLLTKPRNEIKRLMLQEDAKI